MDEAITFLGVEPPDGALRHENSPLSEGVLDLNATARLEDTDCAPMPRLPHSLGLVYSLHS
jgi:hypothetical protein